MVQHSFPLKNKWTIWIHDLYDKNWAIDSYKKLYSFDTIEGFWTFYNILILLIIICFLL